MQLKKYSLHQIILMITIIVVLIPTVLVLITPPGADPDPSWGLQVMHSMERGHSFNLLVSPNPDNIAKDRADFLSWWSPGQYLLPFFFKTLFNLNAGQGIAITVAMCNLLGLAGFYSLFKKLEFNRYTSAISVAFIASQQFFILPYLTYTGGEVILFAFIPWFIYGCYSFKKIDWLCLLYVFFAGIIGFFSKSSAIWMFAAGLACLWYNVSLAQKTKLTGWLRNGLLLAVPMAASIAVIYVFYLSKGENPSQASAGWLFKPETLSFPLASPLLASLSVDELFGGLIYHPEGAMISYPLTVALLFILAAVSLIFAGYLLFKFPLKKYVNAFASFYIVGVLFFSYLFLKQAAISYEGRHFRIIGLLALPGLIYTFNQTKVTRWLFALAWLGFICWGIVYFKNNYQANREAPRGISGISQSLYDQPTLDALSALDKLHHGDAVFVVMSPDIGVEISHNRVITLDIEDMTAEDFSELKFAGKAGALYMLMPQNYIDKGTDKGICKSFTGYRTFQVKKLSKAFSLYTAF